MIYTIPSEKVRKQRIENINFVTQALNNKLSQDNDRLLHIKQGSVPSFKCCNERTGLFDIVSSTDASEFVIKICETCKTKYKEDTIFGHQKLGFPIIKTFKF